MSNFEAIYDDRTVIAGITAGDFAALPETGLLFVIVLNDDGSVEKFKGLDEYTYLGETKPGSWTTPENYAAIKAELGRLSFLLDPTNHVTIDRENAKQKIDKEMVLRAFAEVVMDEINILRIEHSLSERTLSQLVTAIKNKIDVST
ncbi:hypothetical protein KAR91_14255 [Candidatus Pacearchaeota archaeon]|nr:hypothetical protein [Candidatus Pacearchaeota archaeon]